jgi:hypothetical protein
MQIHTSSTVHAALSPNEARLIGAALAFYEGHALDEQERIREAMARAFDDAALRSSAATDHSFREEA